jgi:hypothetical protein
MVDPQDVSQAMEQYVFDENVRKLHAAKAKEVAVKYTWEKSLAPLITRLEQCADDS